MVNRSYILYLYNGVKYLQVLLIQQSTVTINIPAAAAPATGAAATVSREAVTSSVTIARQTISTCHSRDNNATELEPYSKSGSPVPFRRRIKIPGSKECIHYFIFRIFFICNVINTKKCVN